MRTAVNALKVYAFTPAQLLGYEKFWDIVSVERTLYNSARRKGMAEGRVEGLAAGKMEVRCLIAGKMKNRGIPLDIIAQCTNLSIEDIRSL